MADGKRKKFRLYAHYIHVFKLLSNEQAAELFRHILDFANGVEPDIKDLVIKVAFEPIKQDLIEYFESLEAYVYCVLMSGKSEIFIKIGISSNPEKRYQELRCGGKYKVEVIWIDKYNDKDDAFKRETFLHGKYSHASFVPSEPFPGHTECFDTDYLNEINNEGGKNV